MTPDEILARIGPESNPDLAQLVIDWPLCWRFDLPPEPVIVVVGAYKGLAMDLLSRMFPRYAKIVGFEPQLWAASEAGDRLHDRRDMWVYSVGVGASTRDAEMGEWHTDAASFVNTGPGTREQGGGLIVEAGAAFAAANIEHDIVDLMVMNIEGGEYELIPYLKEIVWLNRIDRLAVQWHLYGDVAVAEKRMDAEISGLGAYYELAVDNRPTWTYHVRESR